MAKRKTPLVTGEIYHIYNRGVAGCRAFETARDYQRFFETLYHYHFYPKIRFFDAQRRARLQTRFVSGGVVEPQTALLPPPEKTENPLVEIVVNCFMPTHYHLVLKQTKDKGITEFMQKVGASYTKYFNLKHDRFGPLLQGKFKSVLVKSDEQLIHLSRYIHINPSESSKINWDPKKLRDYPWSSLREYLGLENEESSLCNKKLVSELILEHFKSPQDYEKFVLAQVSVKESSILERITLDDDFGWFSA